MTKLINAIVIPAGNDLMNINIQNDKVTFGEILKGKHRYYILPNGIHLYYQEKANEQHEHKQLSDNFTLQYRGLSLNLRGTVIVTGCLDSASNPLSLTDNQIEDFVIWLESRIFLYVPHKSEVITNE